EVASQIRWFAQTSVWTACRGISLLWSFHIQFRRAPMSMRHWCIGLAVAAATAAASAQLSIVNSVPGTFMDISGTGANLPINGDDVSGTFTSTHGNSIMPAGTLNIQSNGSI